MDASPASPQVPFAPTALDANRFDEFELGPEPGASDEEPTATGTTLPQISEFKLWARQGNTAILLERIAPSERYAPPQPGDTRAPFGTFNGRHVIGSGARIDGGIYLGRKAREAIVVDSTGSLGQIARVYNDFVNRAHGAVEAVLADDRTSTTGFLRVVRRWFAAHLLEAMAHLVAREMPYDERVVRAIARERNLRADDAIDLDVYVLHRGGVCRHQVCLVGVVIELLLRDEWLRGQVFLDRKHVPGYFSHAWVRYVDSAGNSFILDPAQGLYARLDSLDEVGQFFYGRDSGLGGG